MATVDGTNCYGAAVCFSFSLLISPQPRRLYHHHKPKRKGADSPVVRHFFVFPGNAVFSILCPFSRRLFSCVLVLRFCPFTYETGVFFLMVVTWSVLAPPPPSPVHALCLRVRVAAFLFLLCWFARGGGGSHPASTGVEPRANGSVWCAVTSSLSQSSADLHFFFPPPLGGPPGKWC